MSPLSASPGQELLEAVATELAVDPSLVEKDWHATQIIAGITTRGSAEPAPVFSGGTSLSKGYGLIQRFSEDLDFKLLLPGSGFDRAARRSYRAGVKDAIRAGGAWTLSEDDILVRNNGQFLRCDIAYSPMYTPSEPLRTSIRLEMTLKSPALPTEQRPLRSLVAQAQELPPEIPEIHCVVPAETAADKLSALTWRILSQHHGADDDPTVVRHLHDLAALESCALNHPDFPALLETRITEDTSRMKGVPHLAALQPTERVSTVLNILETDPKHLSDYREFVAAMCYGRQDEIPEFTTALSAVQRLAAVLA